MQLLKRLTPKNAENDEVCNMVQEAIDAITNIQEIVEEHFSDIDSSEDIVDRVETVNSALEDLTSALSDLSDSGIEVEVDIDIDELQVRVGEIVDYMNFLQNDCSMSHTTTLEDLEVVLNTLEEFMEET